MSRDQLQNSIENMDQGILKIDHLGIAVESIKSSGRFWEELLGIQITETEKSADQSMEIAFLPVGESEIELIEGLDENNPITKFIKKNGEGFHHIAFRVEDIELTLGELREKGFQLIDQSPRTGAGGAQVAFLHPKSTGGVLVELCQK